jgi:hypothetical protein
MKIDMVRSIISGVLALGVLGLCLARTISWIEASVALGLLLTPSAVKLP